MKVTLDQLMRMYPRVNKNARQAGTGYIPIDVWQAVEKDVRPEMRKRMLRIWYRGTRQRNDARARRRYASPSPTATLKKDATHVVIYMK